MNLKSWFMKNSGNILIASGLLLILITSFYIIRLKKFQNQLPLPEEAGVVDGIDEAPTVIVDESKEASADATSGLDSKTPYSNFIIYIPKLKVRSQVMNGTTTDLLKKGPGLYEKSPLPSKEGGNVCIAGHRTTYGAWFRNVDKLEAGDDIIIEYDGKKYIYKVEKVFVVEKNDWSVTKPVGYSSLTLTSCHPLRSAKQRIVIRAKLEKVNNK